MPAKSKAQLRAAYAALRDGKSGMPKDVAQEIVDNTETTKGLPERRRPKPRAKTKRVTRRGKK